MVLSRQPPKAAQKTAFELTQSIGFAKLYLDDIDAVHRFLGERAVTVVLSAGSATADSADDLRSATKKELEAVAIRTENPDTTLWLSTARCFARTDDPSPEARALTVDVANLVKSEHGGHGALTFWTLTLTQGWMGLLLTAIGILTVLTGTARDWVWPVGVMVGGIAVAIVFGALAWVDRSRRGRAWVIPTRREEARTSNSTMRSTLLSGIAVAIVSVVLTVWVTDQWGS